MEHPNAPVQSPPTQFNLGHGQGNLPPSSSDLTSRDLGRLNPGLFDSDGCYLETSPVYFKVTHVANPNCWYQMNPSQSLFSHKSPSLSNWEERQTYPQLLLLLVTCHQEMEKRYPKSQG